VSEEHYVYIGRQMGMTSFGTLRGRDQVRKSATKSSLGSFPGPDRCQVHSWN